jgi:hypothetical protein
MGIGYTPTFSLEKLRALGGHPRVTFNLSGVRTLRKKKSFSPLSNWAKFPARSAKMGIGYTPTFSLEKLRALGGHPRVTFNLSGVRTRGKKKVFSHCQTGRNFPCRSAKMGIGYTPTFSLEKLRALGGHPCVTFNLSGVRTRGKKKVFSQCQKVGDFPPRSQKMEPISAGALQ